MGAGNDSFTKLLLHFDGADGSTTITDDCAGATAHTFTNHTGSIATSQSEFGGSSYNCGTNGWVDTPDSADFTLGSGDFTIDFWFNRQGGSGARRIMCGQSNSAGNTVPAALELSAANVLHAFVSSNGSTFTNVTGTTAITAAGWHHAALVRTGNTLKLFLDGVQEGGDVSFSGTVFDSSDAFSIGRGGAFTTLTWNGYIDEFRYSVGIARWTSNFTPPTSAYDAGVFLTASAGSFSETGVAALFSAKQASSAGSFIETEVAAPLSTKMASAAGSYALSGVSVSFTVGSFVTASAGSFALTGNAATMKVMFPTIAASYALTGISPAFKSKIASQTGSFALSMGNAISSLDFMAAFGEYQLTGNATSGGFGLLGDSGSYIVTAFPAQFTTTMELWTDQTSGSESWAAQSGSSEIWTPQPSGLETWH